MHNCFCQNVQIFPNYIEKSTHFGLKVSVVYLISSLYVINCFKCFLIYISGQDVPKNQTRKILNYIKSLLAELF